MQKRDSCFQKENLVDSDLDLLEFQVSTEAKGAEGTNGK